MLAAEPAQQENRRDQQYDSDKEKHEAGGIRRQRQLAERQVQRQAFGGASEDDYESDECERGSNELKPPVAKREGNDLSGMSLRHAVRVSLTTQPGQSDNRDADPTEILPYTCRRSRFNPTFLSQPTRPDPVVAPPRVSLQPA